MGNYAYEEGGKVPLEKVNTVSNWPMYIALIIIYLGIDAMFSIYREKKIEATGKVDNVLLNSILMNLIILAFLIVVSAIISIYYWLW